MTTNQILAFLLAILLLAYGLGARAVGLGTLLLVALLAWLIWAIGTNRA